MGVSKSTLIRYRDNTTPIPVDFLERVCRVFERNRRWLILGEGHPDDISPSEELLNETHQLLSIGAIPSITDIAASKLLVEEAIKDTGINLNEHGRDQFIANVRAFIWHDMKRNVSDILRAYARACSSWVTDSPDGEGIEE